MPRQAWRHPPRLWSGAAVISATQINLTWTDNSTNETGFEIDRATNSAFTNGLTTITVGVNVTTYQSTGLYGSTTYYYRVRATIGGSNDSTNSNTANATTSSPPLQLLYDYGLDGNANNLAGPAPNGTLAGTTLPTFEAGVIGQAMNTGTAGYVNLGTAAYPQAISPYAAGSTDGFWTGTLSFWTNSVAGENAGTNWVTGWNGSGVVNTGIYQNWPASGTIGYYASIGSHSLQVQATAPTINIEDESWHLITVSYSLTTGATGTGSGQIWIDGIAQSVTYSANTILGTETISTPTTNSMATDWGYNRNYGFDGKLDDVARWCTQLNDGQAKALYSLGMTGVAGTVYDAADSNSLFNGFLSGTGAVTSDGKIWSFVASGLSGAAGTVGANYVVLDGSGGGMILTPVDVTWTGGSSSIWSTVPGSGNWKKTSDGTTADYGNDINVTFDDTAVGLVADISAADVTPASVTFDNSAANYTVTGTKGIAGAETTVTKQGTGTVTLASVNTYGGLTTIEGGTLQLNGFTKAQVPVISGAGVDLKGGTLVLDYSGEASQLEAVVDLLTASYDAKSPTHFDTGQFQSSTADATHGLGWAYNSVAGQVMLAYTLYGDVNLDGVVNLSDLGVLGDNYGHTGMTWQQGDFNYDGVVNLSDLGYLGDNYGHALTDMLPTGPLRCAGADYWFIVCCGQLPGSC